MAWNVDLPPAAWYTANDGERLGALIAEVADQKVLALDTETTGLDIIKDRPLYWSMAWGERRVCLRADALHHFKDVFKDWRKRWIFANAKYDIHILANVGLHIAGEWCDTAVMHALLYEEESHGLKDMARTVLGWKWTDFKGTFGLSEKGDGNVAKALMDAEQNDLSKLVEYASNDAYGTLKVYEKLKDELDHCKTFSLYPEQYSTLGDIFFKTEMPFTKVLWKCERRGNMIDAAYLESISDPAQKSIIELEKKINGEAGRMINPSSTSDLRQVFLKEMNLRPTKMTKGGKSGVKQPSVDASFLEHYAGTNKLAALILEHRELTKLKGTYIDGLQSKLDKNNRIHPRYNQDVARCMPAGELVLTSRGYLPVEQVLVDDLVVTHTGRTKKVVECSTHKATPIYKVSLSNGLELRTTGNHPYLVGNRWVRADELIPGTSVTVHSDREQWKPITGWSPYEVSSWGRVRNIVTGHLRTLQKKGTWGHLKVSLSRGGAQVRGEDRKDFSVHRLVINAFGTGGKGEVRHLNGIAWDNTIGNLKYGTSSENRQDALKHGTMSQRLAGRSRLTEEDVAAIRANGKKGQPPSTTSKLTQEIADRIRERRVAEELTTSELATMYEVSFQAMDNLLKGKTWNKGRPDVKSSEELAEQYGVSAGTIRDILAGRRWEKQDYIEGSFAKFYESKIVDIVIEESEVTYGLTIEEDESHVTGGIVTHNTGRLSASNPNIQNIPKPENDKFHLRGAFVAPPGKDLIVIDYEALEMRLLACASMEEKMIQIFKEGKDIHMGNAAMVFGKKYGFTYDDVKKAKKIDKEIKEGNCSESDMTEFYARALKSRGDVKAVGFGLNYGMKEDKLARTLGCTPEEAKVVIEEYLDTYPAVRQFYAEAISETEKTGFSFTLIGRRRFHPAILAPREADRWSDQRKAVNNAIQGTAADVVRFAMLGIDAAEVDLRYGCEMLTQVHDELIFECPKENTAKVMPILKELMEHPFDSDLAVELTVSAGKGPNWMNAK